MSLVCRGKYEGGEISSWSVRQGVSSVSGPRLRYGRMRPRGCGRHSRCPEGTSRQGTFCQQNGPKAAPVPEGFLLADECRPQNPFSSS